MEYLTERDAAEILDVSVRMLQSWRYRRQGIPYIKIVGLVRYKRSDIEEFMNAHSIEMDA